MFRLKEFFRNFRALLCCLGLTFYPPTSIYRWKKGKSNSCYNLASCRYSDDSFRGWNLKKNLRNKKNIIINNQNFVKSHVKFKFYHIYKWRFFNTLEFQVLLTFRLDGDAKLEFMNIFTPLHVCLFTLMLTSCGRGGNRWWCGMRSDFCTALLRTCPCLTIYGNVYVGDKVKIFGRQLIKKKMNF